MAWLDKRKTKKGTYYRIGYRENGCIRYDICAIGISYKEANERKREIESRIFLTSKKKSRRRNAVKQIIRTDQIFDWYVEQISSQNYSSVYLKRIEGVCKKLASLFPKLDVNELTVEDIQEFKIHCEKKQASSGINRDLAHLRVVFRKALLKGLVLDDIITKAEFYRIPPKDPDYLSAEEMKVLEQQIQNYPDTMKLAFYILRYTGMRRNSLVHLRWADIDFNKKSIALRAEFMKKREGICIPIHPTLLPMLQSAKTSATQNNVIDLHPDTITHYLRRALNKAGLKHKKASAHLLRHTYATRLAENEIGLNDVASLLGHKSLAMAYHYVHSRSANLQQKINKVDF